MINSLNREDIKKVNQITRNSPFFEKFNQRRYRDLKGYIEHDIVIFNLARTMAVYQFCDQFFFDQDFTHKTSVITLNQAYQQGFASYWLDDKLFDAFNKTHLPKTLVELRQVIPIGILLLPPKIKNPDGQYLKWLLFYHRLADEKILPVKLPKVTLQIIEQPEDTLSWLTILDNGTQYGITKSLIIDNHQLNYDSDNFYINETLQYNGQNIDTKTEKEFGDKVTEILIQTLLYLQIKPEELQATERLTSRHRTSEKVSKSQKYSPIIIGREYQPKTEKTYSSVEGTDRKSPITHWRRGFYKWQPYGSRKETKHKLIWIEPVLVNG